MIDWKYRIVVRGRAIPKKAPKFSRRGFAYTDKDSRAYEEHARLAAQMVMADDPPMSEPLMVRIEVELIVPASWSKKKRAGAMNGIVAPTKRPDVDNLAKLALDACNGIVWLDDAQICALSVVKKYSNTPRSTILVRRIEGMVRQ